MCHPCLGRAFLGVLVLDALGFYMVCSGLSETVISHSVNVWELTRSLHAPDSQISMGGYSQHVIRTFLSCL